MEVPVADGGRGGVKSEKDGGRHISGEVEK
jgi:hypothetical protein